MQAIANITDIVLASASPRRRKLLRDAGVTFEAVSPPIEEPSAHEHGGTAQQVAEALAYFKARTIAERFPDRIVLGADTVVAAPEGEILGKPADVVDAHRMLTTLSASRHAVITGVAIISPGRRLIASETTTVTMRAMTPQELQDYLDSGEWQGKAGAYAIQETADRFVQNVDGSFTNVVGLPMELLGRMLGICSEPRSTD